MKKILLLTLLFPLIGFSQLSGSYVIGTSRPAPFNSLSNAVERINQVGVSGPVVFLLDDNNYSIAAGESFPITIDQFSGSSAANTLTIKPSSGKNVSITADNVNGWTPTLAVFKINGAENIIIDGSNNGSNSKNLTLYNGNNLNYSKRSVIWIANANGANGANNVTIKNLALEQELVTGDLSIGIFGGGTSMGGAPAAANSNITIDNVTFRTMGQGIYVTGSAVASKQSQNWTITNSTFGSTTDSSKGFLGIYLNNIKDFDITNNTLDGFLKSTTAYNPLHSAIYTTGICSDGTISGNKIDNVRETTGSTSTGIYVSGTNISVHNNFVNNVCGKGNGGITNNGFGIFVDGGQNISVYHNTVRLAAAQSSGTSAALFIDSGSALNIRNNIFVNAQANGATRYAVYSMVGAGAFTNIDYNDYVSTQHSGYMGGNKPNLSQWKTATGKDSHSVAISPTFTSSSDLHINPSAATSLDNLGTAIAGVNTDIDYETRSTTTPDIGADEFQAPKCATSTTWNGSAWSNGQPSLTVKAIFNGNYATNSSNLKACDLQVNAGYTVTIAENGYVEVENDVIVYGNLIIENKGSLVQNDASATNTGNVILKRKTSPLKQYDYTYWSAPLQSQPLSVTSSPSIYYSFNPAINNYSSQSATSVMTPGVGYISRAPNNLSYATPQILEVTFNGIPNTGNIAVPVTKAASAFNLIGNPYPSAVDIDEFLVDPDNAPYIGGTIYLWTHNTALSMQNSGTSVFNYAHDDYAKYNVTGGVKTGSAAGSGNAVPAGKVASGQAFFIEALQNGTHNVIFKNSMRSKGTGNNSQFFKPSENTPDANAPIEKNRVWINISNSEDAYDQMLVGYITGATNDLDRAFDGKIFPAGNVVSIYSVLGENNLAIQGRALPFDPSDVVPLGYVTGIAGTFSIALEDLDGLFQDQDVFLYDKSNSTYHNLKLGAYTFSSGIGTFNDRFELRFIDSNLAAPHFDASSNDVIMLAKSRRLSIRAAENISTIEIFDMTGKLLYVKKNVNATEFTSEQMQTTGTAVLAIVTFADSNVVARKIVILERGN
ncbi:MAG: right-handed parallel beta-helix repeat-containing protein [Flavobacterium sp.]|nr:MAG: right-handed parallel beta-helix repeat-containing protein [Flavobacterium sp.]